MTIREVINFLVFIHIVVYVILERLRRPQYVPVMCLSALPCVGLKDGAHELRLALDQLEVHVSASILRVLVVKDSTLLEV